MEIIEQQYLLYVVPNMSVTYAHLFGQCFCQNITEPPKDKQKNIYLFIFFVNWSKKKNLITN